MSMDDETPGSFGTLRQRIQQVVENEVTAGYAAILSDRIGEILGDWEAEALERARAVALEMLGGIAPGNTGVAVANEVANRVMAAALAPKTEV